MTLNVNITVENSIKNIYLLISQMFTTYCRMILLCLGVFFSCLMTVEPFVAKDAKIYLLPPSGNVGFSSRVYTSARIKAFSMTFFQNIFATFIIYIIFELIIFQIKMLLTNDQTNKIH